MFFKGLKGNEANYYLIEMRYLSDNFKRCCKIYSEK